MPLQAGMQQKSNQELLALLNTVPRPGGKSAVPQTAVTFVNNAQISAHAEQTNYGAELFGAAKDHSITLYRIWDEYRWHVRIGGVVGLYGYMQYILYYHSWLTYQSSSWVHWKKEMGLEQLVACDHGKLAQELLQAIQMRYLNTQNHADFLSPIAQFLKDLDCEIYNARTYVAWYELLDKFYGEYIFFLRLEKYEEVKMAVIRLEFLKSLFISWFTKYIVLGNS